MEETGKAGRKTGRFNDDVIVGLSAIAFAAAVFVQIPGSQGDVMLFPGIIGGIIFLSGAFILATALLRPSANARRGFLPDALCLAITVFMLAAMAASSYLGLYACLFVICFAINQLIAFFCGEKGMTPVLRSLALSFIMCGLAYAAFSVLPGFVTPKGLLF